MTPTAERLADDVHPTPRLPVGSYRLHFSSEAPPAHDAYLGSAWRGAFGHALKHTVCLTREPQCPACMLYRTCSYPYLFETPPPPDTAKMRRYQAAPHPFVLTLPAQGMAVAEDGSAYIGVNLFGRANDLLAHVILALQRAGTGGVGPGRRVYQLHQVEQQGEDGAWQVIARSQPAPPATGHAGPQSATGERSFSGTAFTPCPPFEPPCPPCGARVRLCFETPLRVKRQGRVVRADELRFADLFGNLLRRISMLSYFHTQTPLETDFRGLTTAARAVEFAAARLEWRERTRHSSRQDAYMQLGGVVGWMDLEGADLAPFWPYLWLGQWTHAGHFASMGLGRYRIEQTTSLQERR